MAEQAEVKTEKTPEALRQERVAGLLGKGWGFLTNYPEPPESRWVGENLEKKEKLLGDLKGMKTEGKIQDFEIGLPAFKVDGSELPFMRAVYIQHPPQEKPSP